MSRCKLERKASLHQAERYFMMSQMKTNIPCEQNVVAENLGQLRPLVVSERKSSAKVKRRVPTLEFLRLKSAA